VKERGSFKEKIERQKNKTIIYKMVKEGDNLCQFN